MNIFWHREKLELYSITLYRRPDIECLTIGVDECSSDVGVCPIDIECSSILALDVLFPNSISILLPSIFQADI